MEHIPSTIIVHKVTEGADSRYAALNRPYITNPVEQTFGPHQFGVYHKAQDNRPFAFERIENLWGVEETVTQDSYLETENVQTKPAAVEVPTDIQNPTKTVQ